MKDQFEKNLFHMAAKEKMILPEKLDKKINMVLSQQPKPKAKVKMSMRKAFVIAAALVMLFSITVTATVVDALRARMEAMNRKELEDYFSQVYLSKIPADNYNRSLTETEKKRINELEIAYLEEAHFPAGELTMIDQAADYRGKGIAFYKETSTFFFPEKEMSDEELLQIIDFRYKRDYSLSKMNDMIETGEARFPEELLDHTDQIQKTDQSILESEVIFDPATELTFFYTGNLEIQYIAVGQNCIFLTGWNEVHKMEIGSSDSTPFFNDFDKKTRITALCQDESMNVYMGLAEIEEDGAWDLSVLIVDGDGNYINKIDLSSYSEYNGFIYQMVVDAEGYIYLRASGMKEENILMVLDRNGNLIARIKSEDYIAHMMGGLGIGKDGQIYTLVLDKNNGKMGIASVDIRNQCLKDVYMGIVPDDTIMLDIIAPGSDTDFVFWGYDGIFTYNLDDENAVNILPAYEAPCNYEGVCRLALPDGRIVLADRTEYRIERNENGKEEIFAIPDKICFYYISSLQK